MSADLVSAIDLVAVGVVLIGAALLVVSYFVAMIRAFIRILK